MKKVIIILMSLAIIFPIVPMFQTNKVSAAEKIEQPISKNKNRQAIFYAVAEKGGITWNDGADNFHDALKQSDYLTHINADLPNGGKAKEVLEEVKEAFDKKPIPIPDKPGVGKLLLPLEAFLFSYGLTTAAIGIYQNAVQYGENVKTLEDIEKGGASFDQIGDIFTVQKVPYPGREQTVMQARIIQNGIDIGKSIHYGYGYPTGTPISYGFQLEPYTETDPRTGKKTELYSVNSWADSIWEGDGRRHVEKKYSLAYIPKATIQALDGGHVATVQEPKAIGTLNPPDWTKTPQTELPSTVEIELPIDEDGYPDPERQLQPNNPAKNDPKTPLRTAPPDYESNPNQDDESTKSPAPNLTPKPSPQTNPLPQPSPTVPETPPATDTIYPEGDGPKTTPEDTQNRWGALVTNKFPFSLPWDIAAMIQPLMADPVRPYIEVNETFTMFDKQVPIQFSHNFKWMDEYIGFLRAFILIGFNIFLIAGTRKLMGGGQ